MRDRVRRVFVEEKLDFNVEARSIYLDLVNNLEIKNIDGVRMAYAYDISGLDDQEYALVKGSLFKPSYKNLIYEEEIALDKDEEALFIQYLSGQYDQRADYLAKAIETIILNKTIRLKSFKAVIIKGKLEDEDLLSIKNYLINPVEAMSIGLEKPLSLSRTSNGADFVEVLDGFINLSEEELENYLDESGFAMDYDDIFLCQTYFRDQEKRNPSITEMRMIDTYWSDHCRHTTFLTRLERIDFEDGFAKDYISKVFDDYKKSREYVYEDKDRDICLMDIATISMKEMRKRGMLDDLDESEEINACSIVIKALIDGKEEDWLLMFKNETHNHPTEIEPFGGASTCLGGAIRDPLSGRSYVYQAMRITGSGDPRQRVKDTLEGKLPQRKITNTAAAGYSSYGNQIGIATGQVAEIYDPGYIAKRMELGAVVAAAPKENVVRSEPLPGDIVILVGGRTGRDGLGGATGSSKAHTEESMEESGAEVQKGNPAEERKIQRLFRKKEVSTMIKRCNDFGAGGVSVAIGELAPGLIIDLDLVPLKYEGLDGTEIAISESQERMAVVVDKKHEDSFIEEALKENLEATVVAIVTEEARLKMTWKGNAIVDISREFLDTNGAPKSNPVKVLSPLMDDNYFSKDFETSSNYDIKSHWLDMFGELNIASQRGLSQRFDSSIGGGSVLLPLGGHYQRTPQEGMVSKLPLMDGETYTGSIMTYGFNPKISRWSPFHGGVYAVLEAVTKLVALGGDYRKIRLSLQEYFERLDKDSERWGKPFSALLGAYHVQSVFGIPAIGGKDSMSGSFNELSVPPTLVAFAVAATDVRRTLSSEFKKANSKLILIDSKLDDNNLPDFDILKNNFDFIHGLIKKGLVLSARSLRDGGLAEAISEMSLGNEIGLSLDDSLSPLDIFSPSYGSIVLEIGEDQDIEKLFEGIDYRYLGSTIDRPTIEYAGLTIGLEELLKVWEEPLKEVFTVDPLISREEIGIDIYDKGININPSSSFARPRVLIPIFPGTSSEYDLIKAFKREGGQLESFVFKNLNLKMIEESLDELKRLIQEAQIVVIAESASIADEYLNNSIYGSAVLGRKPILDSLKEHIEHKDGLILGVGAGFKSLLNLGLISDEDVDIGLNPSGHHLSTMGKFRLKSNLSPWYSGASLDEEYSSFISMREGQILMEKEVLDKLAFKGQIASLFSSEGEGLKGQIEAITSSDGRVLGRLGRDERFGENVAINIPDKNVFNIFKAGIDYYK